MILVDSSVWIDHFARGDAALVARLEAGEVLTHPFVIGELACGRLAHRQAVLELLHALPTAGEASQAESLALIERRHLHGLGLGIVDVHLLASALLTGCRLWTRDRALREAAFKLGIATAG